MIKICCVTGTRADYPRIRSVLKLLDNDPYFDLQIIVTGSHLLEEYGSTYKEIIDDGFKISKKVEMFTENFDTPHGMTRCVGEATKKLADAYEELKPDVMLITVDRVETLAAASAAALMNLPIFHVQGGEVTGTIDESIRHAVTKLSHFHFAATEESKNRIISMGEPFEKVFNTGCPYIDELNSYDFISKEEITRLYNLEFNKKTAILTLHPVTTEHEDSLMQIKTVLEAIKNFDINIISIYSNSDAGGKKIINLLKNTPRLNLIPNIKSDHFASLMKNCDLMIGNSSAGIREAPSFSLPVVNIGSRQNKRERGRNVIDCQFKKNDIRAAIEKALYDDSFKSSLVSCPNIYGDGRSADRIVNIIKEKTTSKIDVQKIITY